MSKKFLILCGVIAIVVISGVFLILDAQDKKDPVSGWEEWEEGATPVVTGEPQNAMSSEAPVQDEKKTYRNEGMGFSVVYSQKYVHTPLSKDESVFENGAGKIHMQVVDVFVYSMPHSEGCKFSLTDSMYTNVPAFCKEMKREDYKIGETQDGFPIYLVGRGETGKSILHHIVTYKNLAVIFEVIRTHTIAGQQETQQEQQAVQDAKDMAFSFLLLR